MPRRKAHVIVEKCGWRVDEFCDSTGIGRAFCYELMRDQRIKSVKVDGARIILDSPRDFLNSFDKREL